MSKKSDFWLREFERFLSSEKKIAGLCPECKSKETYITLDDHIFHCEKCGFEKPEDEIVKEVEEL